MNKVKNLDKEKAKTLSQKHRKNYTTEGKKKNRRELFLFPTKSNKKILADIKNPPLHNYRTILKTAFKN